MHSLLGFAISMLLVFRTNTAYDRWWEGRKLWGQLVNVSRNLAVKIAVMVPHEQTTTREFFGRLIGMFPEELRRHLQLEKTRLELDDKPHPEIPDLDRSKHVPSQVISLMQQRIQRMYHEKNITGDQLIVLSTELVQFLDICGACERIKNTPIPYSYSSFIKKFIVIYVLTLPFGFVFSLGYIAIPVVMFIFYVLASLELIAEEIEDPFGTDTNDLPMARLGTMIKKNVDEILN
jgi:putative membrane protein